MLESEFMRLAFATGAVVGLLAPAVGFFLVQRNMSLVGDGVGHTAFAGVAAGYLLGVSPVLTALIAAVAGAVGLEWLRSRRQAAGDQALALLFYTGLALGVVLASSAGALNVNLFSFLFGSILTVTREDLVVVAVLGVAGLATVTLLYRALVGVVVDEEGARVAGVPVIALNVLVAGLAGLTIGLSMQIVGILLIAALMVLPVIASGRVAWSMRSSILLAMAIGLASVFAGSRSPTTATCRRAARSSSSPQARFSRRAWWTPRAGVRDRARSAHAPALAHPAPPPRGRRDPAGRRPLPRPHRGGRVRHADLVGTARSQHRPRRCPGHGPALAAPAS